MFMKGFSFNIERRKKRVNNEFKGDYFSEKQEKIYIIEDEQGVFFQCNTSFISFFVPKKTNV